LIFNTKKCRLWGYKLVIPCGKFVSYSALPADYCYQERIKHFTSAFGEHVIAEEIESAINATTDWIESSINDFHLAPQSSNQLKKNCLTWNGFN